MCGCLARFVGYPLGLLSGYVLAADTPYYWLGLALVLFVTIFAGFEYFTTDWRQL
ncbi:hypothetical protein KSB_39540 [Ktedonobacter robiniae]|uniref:Major facilitator superfamily (MFS) profile domain-containing protein n=1 Tax=Ktedonobacter robiniae TaxID=2778365 RepID=A0ABQ3URY1_9CHLR|nr:hypothetical protein KSB_39540 [Ktedonobacter robiniae]